MNRVILLSALVLLSSPAQAGPVFDMVAKRQLDDLRRTSRADPITVRYGDHEKQEFDIFLPRNPQNAPVIALVQSGGWKAGNQNLPTAITDNKEIYWVNKGYIYIRINYRPYPDANLYEQAQDIARAIARIQEVISGYNGDPNSIIIIGHSTGAHLLALLSANPAIAYEQGTGKWRATIVLDSAIYNVTQSMSRGYARPNNDPFGDDPRFWSKISPVENITQDAIPMLLVCSPRRTDNSCAKSREFAYELGKYGFNTPVMREYMSNGELITELGLPNLYTGNVNRYIEQQLGY